MDLKIFKTLWGHVGSFEAACADAVNVGFDGIEGPSHSSRAVRNAYQRTLNDHGLGYIAEITTGREKTRFKEGQHSGALSA